MLRCHARARLIHNHHCSVRSRLIHNHHQPRRFFQSIFNKNPIETIPSTLTNENSCQQNHHVTPKSRHSQAFSQDHPRTARWPWLFVLNFWLLIRNLITSWLSHFSPIPTTQHTIPRRKPLRRSADWELRLTEPRHYRRAIAQILMQSNVIVKVRKPLCKLRLDDSCLDF
jgi:hypothetical protein